MAQKFQQGEQVILSRGAAGVCPSPALLVYYWAGDEGTVVSSGIENTLVRFGAETYAIPTVHLESAPLRSPLRIETVTIPRSEYERLKAAAVALDYGLGELEGAHG